MKKAKIGKKDVDVYRRWRDDWNLFVSDVLRARLDDEQKAIVSAVQHERMVAVASGTARGKDFVAACIALCFLYLTPKFDKRSSLVENTKVVMTAPTARQVANIMTPEVRRLFRQAQVLPGRLVSNDIRTDYEEWFLTGFKADEENKEAWSGLHAVNILFLVTEASGISETIYESIEGNLQGNSRLAIFFNPNTRTGYAAKAMSSPRFKHFRLSSLNAENVVSKEIRIPGQVDYAWVKDKIDSWCHPIKKSEVTPEEDDFEFEGCWYRPEDLFRVKVLGKFPKVSADVLIPSQWVEQAMERWKVGDVSTETSVLGVDVAGMGRDSTAYCDRRGYRVEDITTYNSGGRADHMKVAGRIISFLRANAGSSTSIDTIGEGAGVYSAVLEQIQDQWRVISCKFSQAARSGKKDLMDVTGQYSFINMRAYLFWAVRDWLDPKNGSVAELPPSDELLEDISQITWGFNSQGKVYIEPKEDIKKKLGRSTDTFDALANTFYPMERVNKIDKAKLAKFVY